jgi:hypothetical protein
MEGHDNAHLSLPRAQTYPLHSRPSWGPPGCSSQSDAWHALVDNGANGQPALLLGKEGLWPKGTGVQREGRGGCSMWFLAALKPMHTSNRGAGLRGPFQVHIQTVALNSEGCLMVDITVSFWDSLYTTVLLVLSLEIMSIC